MIPIFSFRESVTFTPLTIGRGRERGAHVMARQAALGLELNQCHQRDLWRTTESHRWTENANPAGGIDRHSGGHVEPLHEAPPARRRSNRASNRQPHLTTVAVSRELQQSLISDHLLGPVGLVPECDSAEPRRHAGERTLWVG